MKHSRLIHVKHLCACSSITGKSYPTPKPSPTSTGRMTDHKKGFVYTKGQRFKQQKLPNTKIRCLMLHKKQFHRKLTPFDIPLRRKRFSTGGIVEVRKRGGGNQGGGNQGGWGLPNQRLRCIPLATSKSQILSSKNYAAFSLKWLWVPEVV